MGVHLLEEDDCIRNILRLTLEARAYFISESPTPERALEICCTPTGQPDLLISDVHLPITSVTSSGVEVAVHLKGRIPNLRIILISDLSLDSFNDQDAAPYKQLPPESVRLLQKPFMPADVLRAVDSLMG